MSEETSNENPEQDPTKDSQVSEINEKSNSEPTGPEAEMAELKTQLEKAQNDYLYLRAEFENYKKQMIKERSDYLKYGSERLVVGFLDVLDNFDRALTIDLDPAKPENIESYKQGMEMTAKEFKSTLKKFSVEEVELFMITVCLLSDRYDFSHVSKFPVSPNSLSHFAKSPACHIFSKYLLMSK